MTLEQFQPPSEPPAMLNPATDSWSMVLHDVAELSRLIADTDFVPSSLRGNVGKVAAAILHGRELGLPPMTSLSQTAIINGRPTISAEAMRGLILQAGHELEFDEQTGSRCVVRGRRQGSDNWTRVEWTSGDAERAGLARRDTYKSYPRQMLAARATAELARLIFPDALHGMKAAEELDDSQEPSQVRVAPDPAPRSPVRRSKPRPVTPDREGEPEARQEPTLPPPPAPVRQRPAIKPRGVSPVAGEAPDAAETPVAPVEGKPEKTDTEPDTEVVAEPIPFEPAGRIDTKQVAAIVMHFERLGITDRGIRIAAMCELVGRKVASTKDLDTDEAERLLDRLAHLRNQAALEQAIG